MITPSNKTYIFSILYAVLCYLAAVLGQTLTVLPVNIRLLLFCVPVLFAVLRIVLTAGKISSASEEHLLCHAVLMKYLMVPFYGIGSLSLLLSNFKTNGSSASPIGPTPAWTIFLLFGFLYLLGSSFFSVIAILKSNRQQLHSPLVCVLATICQFFFVLDVLTIMTLALKENRCIKGTIALVVGGGLSLFTGLIWLTIDVFLGILH